MPLGRRKDNALRGADGNMREHPLRQKVVGEMHLRRWPRLQAPATILQVLRLVGEGERADEQARLDALPPGANQRGGSSPRHRSGILPGPVGFVWERHTEASTFTLFAAADVAPAALDAARDWGDSLPGEVIRATRIHVEPDEEVAARRLETIAFTRSDLVSCHLAGGARLWSDFRIGPDGFGRFIVAANGMDGSDLSRLVQRVQELGNYRNLALLGLPVAQDNWQELDRIERELNALSGEVTDSAVTDDTLLARVSALSLALMTIAMTSSYRVSATEAYARLVEERLEQIEPQPIPGFQSLTDFTQRRLLPAVRTCAAQARREQQLSERAARFTSLLRTRIETRIENQNARLLESMEHSASVQLRLQQLVEGLSVVALSYYALGLIAYLLKGAEEIDRRIDAPVILAVAMPVIVLGVWLTVKRLKRKLLGPH